MLKLDLGVCVCVCVVRSDVAFGHPEASGSEAGVYTIVTIR
jgi:hypothetical protein